MSDGTSRAPEPGADVSEGQGSAGEVRALGGCLPFIIGLVVVVLGFVAYLVYFNHFG